MSFGARILILGWIVVGVMGLAVVIVLTLGLRAQNRAELWVNHTLQVENGVKTVEADAYAMVGGLRGYLLSRRSDWIEESRRRAESGRQSVSRVQDLTADNPVQRANVAALRRDLEEEAAWSEHIIALSQQSGFQSAVSAVASGDGETVLRKIAADTGRMLAEEQRLLSIRVAETARIRRAGYAAALALSALALIQLVASAFLIRARYRAFAREQLLLSQARTYAESIVETVREPLLVLDSYLHIVSANRSFYLTFGLAPGEVKSVSLAELDGGRWNIPELLARLHAVADGKQETLENFALDHGTEADQKRHLVLNARRIFRPGNHSDLTLLAIEDDTERTRSEERLRQINAELEGFAYTVAHDLRAPLRGMQGFSEALIEDYSGRLDAVGIGYAQHIGSAARRMDELIRDLLEYSRLARIEVQLEPVPVAQALAMARQQVAAVLEAAHAEVVVRDPLPTVRAQFAILVQILANLLSNAAKFVPAGQTPKIVVRAEAGPGRHRLWIEDNGIGIAPEFQERIFRVFERLHSADTYPGTGIGLAIVRKGAERMGARVGVQSTLGQGARFWVELPAG